MRKLSVGAFMTLDGVVQAPGGPGEDESGGFTFGGWSFHYWDDLMGEVMTALDEPAVRSGARQADVRRLRGVLAERLGGAGREAAERRDQIRGVAWHDRI